MEKQICPLIFLICCPSRQLHIASDLSPDWEMTTFSFFLNAHIPSMHILFVRIFKNYCLDFCDFCVSCRESRDTVPENSSVTWLQWSPILNPFSTVVPDKVGQQLIAYLIVRYHPSPTIAVKYDQWNGEVVTCNNSIITLRGLSWSLDHGKSSEVQENQRCSMMIVFRKNGHEKYDMVTWLSTAAMILAFTRV